MNGKLTRGLGTGALVLALSLLLPSTAQAQQRSGVETWEATCSRCHSLHPTNKYYPKDWRSVGTHMTITARLTSAQSEAVIAFLISGARSDATAALPAAMPSRGEPASVELSEELVAQPEDYVSGREDAPELAVTPQ